MIFNSLIENRRSRKIRDFLKLNNVPEYLSRFIHSQVFDKNLPILGMDYLFVDIETTGLNSESDCILSIGWVCIIDGKLDISTSSHHYIKRYKENMSFESSVIHHIMPEMLEYGIELDTAISELFVSAQGKRIVVHGSCIEARFFSNYFKLEYDLNTVPIAYIDTILIEKYFCEKFRTEEDFRLLISRKRYGLNEAISHDALIDSISTAELFLCQVERLKKLGVQTFGDLCRISQVM